MDRQQALTHTPCNSAYGHDVDTPHPWLTADGIQRMQATCWNCGQDVRWTQPETYVCQGCGQDVPVLDQADHLDNHCTPNTTTEATMPTTTDHTRWTLAFRKPTANRFRRVTDVAVSWREAVELAREAGTHHPDLDIWYVPTAATEATSSVPEDRGNVLTLTGRRVRIVDDAVMADLAPAEPPEQEATVGTMRLTLSHVGPERDSLGGFRQVYSYTIQDTDTRTEYVGDDIRSGVNAQPDTRHALSTLVSFLMAAAEELRRVYPDGDDPLFPQWVAELADHNDSELGMLAFTLREAEQHRTHYGL